MSEPPTPLLPQEGWPKAGVVGAAGGQFVGQRRFKKDIQDRQDFFFMFSSLVHFVDKTIFNHKAHQEHEE